MFRAALLAAASLLLTSGLALADSFRCGTRLVTDGDSTDKVAALCGRPETVERSEVWRRPQLWHRGRPYYTGRDPVAVSVEFWVYNFGPHRLMRRLRFEDGLLVEVETLGHGYHGSRGE
jgi:hypothetical protein